MPWAEVQRYLSGALRLARFDVGGLARFGDQPRDARRSFYAAVVVAPLYVLWVSLHGPAVPEQASFAHYFLFEALSYSIGWLIFPLVMWRFCEFLNCGQRFFHFITVYNWTAVIQNGLFMAMDLLCWLFGAPDQARGFFGMVLLVYILIYSWFVARHALALPFGQALAVVTLDMLTSLLWEVFSGGLSTSR
ncbi:MAG: hypothetical protein WD075_03665 [Rhodospirillales bacterium]